MQTKYCVECHKVAKRYCGHVHKISNNRVYKMRSTIVLAGWCNDHGIGPFLPLDFDPGCMGRWEPRMGIQNPLFVVE